MCKECEIAKLKKEVEKWKDRYKFIFDEKEQELEKLEKNIKGERHYTEVWQNEAGFRKDDIIFLLKYHNESLDDLEKDIKRYKALKKEYLE